MDSCIKSRGLVESKLMHSIRSLTVMAGSLLIVVSSVMAQRSPQIEVDYASFAYDERESLVELYVAVEASSPTYAVQDSGYSIAIPLHLSLVRSSADANRDLSEGRPVWVQEDELHFFAPDTSSIIEGRVFLRQTRFTVLPGKYELQVDLLITEQEVIQSRRDLVIPDYSQWENCLLSDIILASSIVDSNDNEDPHYKNGLSVVPNTNQLYGADSAQLFYYVEAYNTACAASDSGEYTVLVYVAEASSPVWVPGLEERSERNARQTDVLVGSFDLSDLRSGTYFLHVAILSSTNETVVEESRKFFVFNPSVNPLQSDVITGNETFETSSYATMTEEEIERGLKYIQVIANEREFRQIRRVQDLDERRRLLMDFWEVRDPTPGAEGNEFRDEFYRLLTYANERYSAQRVEGWETDRGNTLLRYGRPTNIESNMYERGRKPYEIWKYNNIPGEGQAEFIFADLDGFGDFELIHSTVAGERKLPDWPQRISDRY